MGAVVKLLFKQLESRSALRASPHFPHRPLVVQKIKIFRVVYQCACGKCIHYGSIRSGFFVHFAKLIHFDSLHCISPSFYAFTSAPHSFGKYSFTFRKLHSFRFLQALSNANPMVYFYFLRRVCPKDREPQYFPTAL